MKYAFPVLMFTSLLVLAGCDQAEKSAQQLMGKAAESAKQAIDDTHKAAEQALSEATGGLNEKKEAPEKDTQTSESSSKTI
jgi:vacuolar-type H+-ATPase subunit H